MAAGPHDFVLAMPAATSSHNAAEAPPDSARGRRTLKGGDRAPGFQLWAEDHRLSRASPSIDDGMFTGKVAWVHLKEFPDYYSRWERL